MEGPLRFEWNSASVQPESTWPLLCCRRKRSHRGTNGGMRTSKCDEEFERWLEESAEISRWSENRGLVNFRTSLSEEVKSKNRSAQSGLRRTTAVCKRSLWFLMREGAGVVVCFLLVLVKRMTHMHARMLFMKDPEINKECTFWTTDCINHVLQC